KAILVKSANDAAMALARDVGGSAEGFASMMNRRALRLGMTSSHFKNPHGLTEAGQFSTARDIALLARAAYQRPEIRRYLRVREYQFVHSDGRTKKLENTNELLDQLSYATGMKTGTTRASGKCLVSSAELNGRVVIAVLLGSTSKTVWNDSEALLRWALEFPAALPVAAE
ncbi:MAG: D-alanyl-D-alanine carboxypeptidase, partial [Akkermansiaceae bacterium]|nr:D-alanyl-D-alanine carboxypeptidase [Akkermansiaceae bacterium]